MTRILVADDLEQNRYLLASLLRGNGFDVDETSNGAEALEHARRNPPDLVITDLLMPEMDGFELCRQWKKDEALKHIPLVVYTATYTDRADERLVMSLGADQFLVKPQKVDVLLEAVRDVLARAAAEGTAAPPAMDDTELLLSHNTILLRKLEKKVHELEAEIAQRTRAEEERTKLQGQLLSAQRIESIGRLAGGVAHDFNNLLSVILVCAGFALDKVPDDDPVHGLIEEIRKAGERAASLTRQLLAFGRKQFVEPEVLDLNRIVTQVETMLRRLLGERIEIVVRPEPDLGNVLADPGQVEQIIMNLAVNARDAMPSGGKLLIETANAELDESYVHEHLAVAPGPYVMLSVTDTGTGMDSATVERVFDPFFTTKEKGKGTGLGLSMVYGMVKQSNGHIWVYSELGRGTAFKIYLPRVDADAAEVGDRPLPELVTGNETVLIVEDEEAVRRVAARILRSAGYSVEVAADGIEALRLAEGLGEEASLLLTDLVMPRMNGPELAKRLTAIWPRLRTLYMSGYADDSFLPGSVLAPGTRFISKPFSAADLTRVVREALDVPPAPPEA